MPKKENSCVLVQNTIQTFSTRGTEEFHEMPQSW